MLVPKTLLVLSQRFDLSDAQYSDAIKSTLTPFTTTAGVKVHWRLYVVRDMSELTYSEFENMLLTYQRSYPQYALDEKIIKLVEDTPTEIRRPSKVCTVNCEFMIGLTLITYLKVQWINVNEHKLCTNKMV